MIHEAVLPGATVFVGALKIVCVEEGQRLAVTVEDFKNPHVRVVNRKILPLLESDAVEFVRREEDTVVQHPIEFEIGFDLRVIEIVFSLAHLLGVVLPVLRPELKAALLGVNQLLHARCFGAGFSGGRRHNAGQKFLSGLRRLGHLIIECESRVIGITE